MNSNSINDAIDIVTYTILVKNNGNLVLTNTSIIGTFTDVNGGASSFTGSPTFVSSSAGSAQG